MDGSMEFISSEVDFTKRAIEIQQYWYENFGDRDWDRYLLNEHYNLKQTIGYALFGPPSQTPGQANEAERTNANENDLGYTNDQFEQIIKIYNLLLKHNYVEELNVILIRVIFIIGVLKDSKLDKGKYLRYVTYSWKKNESREKAEEEQRKNRIIQVPLFVVKKCKSHLNSESTDLCNIFIDNEGRVYQSWKLFLENNKLPQCVMYCPLKGKYSGHIVRMNADKSDGEVEVKLEILKSPACGVGQKVLNVIDTAGTFTSLGATGVFVTAAIPSLSVAPFAIIGAGVACATVGFYSAGRSIAELVDRGKHEQKIGLDDAEARNCWINAATASVSTVAGAASGLLSRAVSNGKVIGNGARLAFNASQIAALASSGVALGNSGYFIIMKMYEDKEISALDVFQFSTSVLFLFKSAVSFKTATTIINETRASILKDYQYSLRSNRHRKVFNKALKETIRVNGVDQGTAEVISGIRNIQDKDNFFAGLARRNKEFNQNNVKYTLTADGQVLLNSVHTVDPAEFAKLAASERKDFLSNLFRRKPCVPKDEFFTTKATVSNWVEGKICTYGNFKIGLEVVESLAKLISINFSVEGIAAVLCDLMQEAVNYVLLVYVEIYPILENFILDNLRRLFPLVDANMVVLQFVKSCLQEMSSAMNYSLMTFIKKFINPDGSIQEQVLLCIKEKLIRWMEALEGCKKPAEPFVHTTKKRFSCGVCKGFYWVV